LARKSLAVGIVVGGEKDGYFSLLAKIIWTAQGEPACY